MKLALETESRPCEFYHFFMGLYSTIIFLLTLECIWKKELRYTSLEKEQIIG